VRVLGRGCGKKRGFALALVLVAAAVAAAMAAGLAAAATTSSRMGRELSWKAEALSLARSEMEAVFAQPLNGLSGTPSAEVPGWPGFYRAVGVEPLADGGTRVTVTVTYPAGEVVLYAERHPWPR